MLRRNCRQVERVARRALLIRFLHSDCTNSAGCAQGAGAPTPRESRGTGRGRPCSLLPPLFRQRHCESRIRWYALRNARRSARSAIPIGMQRSGTPPPRVHASKLLCGRQRRRKAAARGQTSNIELLTPNAKTLQQSKTQYRLADRLAFEVKRSRLGVEPAAGASRHIPMPPRWQIILMREPCPAASAALPSRHPPCIAGGDELSPRIPRAPFLPRGIIFRTPARQCRSSGTEAKHPLDHQRGPRAAHGLLWRHLCDHS